MSTVPERLASQPFAVPVPDGGLRVLLVEQHAAQGTLRDLLPSTPGVEVVADCDDCLAAGALLRLHAPDLLILDVELPGSAELLAALRDRHNPPAVVATAFDPFLLRGFRTGTVDCLLKPVASDRVEKALLLAHVEVLRGRSEILRRQLHLVEQEKPRYLEFLNVPIDRHTLRMAVTEVDWFHSAGNYVRLHAGDQAYALRHTLKALELSLDPQHFQRIHRGVIVNINRIASVHSHASGRMRIQLHNGTHLRLGRCYRGELRHLLRNIL